ncbi:MAG: LptE family protein [Bacteroidales bacterium]|nr:LptE family protein [Bacteroidales bacterium]MBN2757048.1 LptE family protein [Bacteroidales bacterium]
MLYLFKINILILFAGLFTGCGIYSFSGASIPPEAKTVSVDYFPNNARVFNPTLSQQITEMLQDKLISQTSLNLTETYGDLSFKGEITDYKVTPVSLVANETAAYNRLTITVKVEFINVYDENANFNQSFSRYSDFESSRNLTDIEPEIVPEILELIIEDIFNKAVVNW